jgi:hypothetical protein
LGNCRSRPGAVRLAAWTGGKAREPHHGPQIDLALLLTGRAEQPQPRFPGEDRRADVRRKLGAVAVAVLRVLAPLDVGVPLVDSATASAINSALGSLRWMNPIRLALAIQELGPCLPFGTGRDV